MDEQPERNMGAAFFDRVWELLLLNLLWVLACLPVLTAGPATAAAYSVAFLWQKGEAPPVWGAFWTAFRQNLRQGFLAQLVCFLLLGLGAALLQVGVLVPGAQGLLTALAVLVLALGLLSCLLVFPILAKFDLTLGQAFQNGLYLLVRHTLPVMGTVLTAAVGAGFVIFLAPPLMLVMGGLVIYLNSITLAWVFDKIVRNKPTASGE